MIYKVKNEYVYIPLSKALPINWNSRTAEEKALAYAEEHGICEYHVRNDAMVYYTSFPLEHITYKAIVDLDTLKETRTPMKRYYKSYKSLVGGRYQSNYKA